MKSTSLWGRLRSAFVEARADARVGAQGRRWRRGALTSELIPYMAVGVVLVAVAGSAVAVVYSNYQNARAGSDVALLTSYLRNTYAATQYPAVLNDTVIANLPAGFTSMNGTTLGSNRLPDITYAQDSGGSAYMLTVDGADLSAGVCGEVWRVLAQQLVGAGTSLSGAGVTGDLTTVAAALDAIGAGVMQDDGSGNQVNVVACATPDMGTIAAIEAVLR